ncbi:MAG: cellulase family glycosylhydrolase [Methylibium sp.]|nr:cellulase family glycosylhydrolase [Methylibium sp.]
MSFLNEDEKPAGRRGFVRAQGDALMFGDGSTARFWGTNLTAAALFGTEPQAVRQQARRLSRLGFNLVRLHHHDSHWVKPNIFGPAGPRDTRRLDPTMLERIDWWVKCLKDEGIYVWLDLHVQRQLRAGDAIAGFDEIAKGRPGAEFKGYNYVNPDIRQAMQRFNEAYLGHVNTHTGLAYKDDPAIVAVLVTNENDLTHHFGNALLPNKNVPHHTAAYLREAQAFARTHDLPERRVWRSWEPGPSKRFLNDLEHRFNAKMIAHLRRIGVKVPIVTTSLWGAQMASLPALTDGDMIDVHAYETPGPLARDPRTAANVVHLIATAQVVDKPVSVTEWNMSPFPAADRHVLPLYMAANASHQGWDALMQYAYAQTPLQQPGPPSNWHAFNDPALLSGLPAAALLFRQGHVQAAQTVRVLQPTASQLFDEGLTAGGTAAMRIAAEGGRLLTVLPEVPQLPWLRPGVAPIAARHVDDGVRQLADMRRSELRSDTGELWRNWKQGIFTIETPRTQAALGRIGGRSIDLPQVRIALTNAQASIAVQSLDGKPIDAAHKLLVSMATASLPKGPKQGPFFTEPAVGVIEIEAAAGMVLQPGPHGAAGDSDPQLDYVDGKYTLRFAGKNVVQWVVLSRPERTAP